MRLPTAEAIIVDMVYLHEDWGIWMTKRLLVG